MTDNSSSQRVAHRYEKKYRTNLFGHQELIAIVKSHSALFKESYPARIVNSLYLDTKEHSFLEDNLAGISRRVKPRIRWYGQQPNSVRDANLELKFRQNTVGHKETYRFGSFSLLGCDSNIEYWPFSGWGRRSIAKFKDYGTSILELKYDHNVANVGRITKELPFRFTKSSKYVTGILCT